MLCTRAFLIAFALLSITISISSGQASRVSAPEHREQHGTCATMIESPFGSVFIIDSRITEIKGETVIGHHPGCKVKLARPAILIAGVGITDTSGDQKHWNSLDEAAKALEQLPQFPSKSDLESWGGMWAETLIRHYRSVGYKPGIGVVSEILLLTNIEKLPFFERVTTTWDGSSFKWRVFRDRDIIPSQATLQYSGACRDFVTHYDFDNNQMPPTFASTLHEQERFDALAIQRIKATTLPELVKVAIGLESVLADKDLRIEGENGVIAAPFAIAELPATAIEWTTAFNSECSDQPKVVPSAGIPR